MSNGIVKVDNKLVSTQVDNFFDNWDKHKRIASELMKGGFLPKHYTAPEQVVAVMLKGKELGIPPMEALTNLYVVNGRVGMMGQLMIALVRRSGKLGELKITVADDKNSVTCYAKRSDNGEEFSSTFSQDDAKTAGLLTKNDSIHLKYPVIMKQWRAVANCFRVLFADILTGMYLPEELGIAVEVDDDGNEKVSKSSYFDETSVYNNCIRALDLASKKRKYEDLKLWFELFKSDLDQLSDKFKDMLRRAYQSALDHLPEAEKQLIPKPADKPIEKGVENGTIGNTPETITENQPSS